VTQNDLRLCDPGTDNFPDNGAPVPHKTILLLQLTVLQYNAVTLLNSAVSAGYELISKCSVTVLTEKLFISLLHTVITIKVLNSLLLCFTM